MGTSVSEGIGAFEKNTSASVRIHFDTTSLAKGEYVAELAAVAFRVQEAIADLHLRCTIHSMDG